MKKHDEFMIAIRVNEGTFDPAEGLEENTIILNGDTNFGDILEVWSIKEIKWLCKKGRGYHYPYGPVGLIKRPFKEKEAMEAFTRKFEGLEDMVHFMKDNKGLLIYQVIHNTVRNTYALRYFVNKNKAVQISYGTYLYNYFKFYRIMNKRKK